MPQEKSINTQKILLKFFRPESKINVYSDFKA